MGCGWRPWYQTWLYHKSLDHFEASFSVTLRMWAGNAWGWEVRGGDRVNEALLGLCSDLRSNLQSVSEVTILTTMANIYSELMAHFYLCHLTLIFTRS